MDWPVGGQGAGKKRHICTCESMYIHIYIGIEMGMFETWGACSHPFDAQDNERGKY